MNHHVHPSFLFFVFHKEVTFLVTFSCMYLLISFQDMFTCSFFFFMIFQNRVSLPSITVLAVLQLRDAPASTFQVLRLKDKGVHLVVFLLLWYLFYLVSNVNIKSQKWEKTWDFCLWVLFSFPVSIIIYCFIAERDVYMSHFLVCSCVDR